VVRTLIGPVFLVLTGWLFITRDWADIPHAEHVPIARQDITTDPMRRPLPDPPWVESGGYELTCMACHRIFESLPDKPRRLMQHRHVALDHGLNDRCLNCHDRDDRNLLVLASGETILFADAPRLCAQCHGTTYRDWSQGMHGRTNDYWDVTRGPRRRLSCTECHDPHAPAYDAMRPLAGPNTLRMGKPHRDRHAEAVGKRNPLRHWSMAEPRAHAADDEPAGGAAGKDEAR